MAASSTGFPVADNATTAQTVRVRSSRPRRIDPASGRALEILGHAIEYLADELVESGVTPSANNPQIEAIQLLMTVNRQVYFACPEVRTLADRLRSWLHFRSA